jgi:AhpD family alkylhydroperoxidase
METIQHQPRVGFKDADPRVYPLMMELGKYINSSSLDMGLLELIKIRASQINQCAFCLDMHIREALERGEDINRIHLLTVWREAPLYTEAERAVLELTEAVTHIATQGVPDDLYERVRRHFDARQYIDLLMAISIINTWNRLNVATRNMPRVRTATREAVTS